MLGFKKPKGHRSGVNSDFCLSVHIYHFLMNLQKSSLSTIRISPLHTLATFVPIYYEIVGISLDLLYFDSHLHFNVVKVPNKNCCCLIIETVLLNHFLDWSARAGSQVF